MLTAELNTSEDHNKTNTTLHNITSMLLNSHVILQLQRINKVSKFPISIQTTRHLPINRLLMKNKQYRFLSSSSSSFFFFFKVNSAVIITKAIKREREREREGVHVPSLLVEGCQVGARLNNVVDVPETIGVDESQE